MSMTTSEPTPSEIVRALRECDDRVVCGDCILKGSTFTCTEQGAYINYLEKLDKIISEQNEKIKKLEGGCD